MLTKEDRQRIAAFLREDGPPLIDTRWATQDRDQTLLVLSVLARAEEALTKALAEIDRGRDPREAILLRLALTRQTSDAILDALLAAGLA